MSMTMTQKILAAHAGLQSVTAGQLIEAKLDLVLGNDVTSPVAINEMAKKGFKDVFSTDKIALVMDHFTPTRILNPPKMSNRFVFSQRKRESKISLTWEKWV